MQSRVSQTIALALALGLVLSPETGQAQQKGNAPQKRSEGAQLVVHHKCLNITLLTGLKIPAADHYVYLGDKRLGASPLCSTRTFQVPPGEHSINLGSWSGKNSSFIDRKARFASGQTVHIMVDKGAGFSAFWAQLTSAQASEIAREIASVNKK
ncbi:MAG: hypothetical protein NW223_19615 [Hyphomicrobiaceae bacterium]|nr:hypothetical protein [Hyphomicrobiaceae bacterium]